jgi:nitroreductase
MCLAAAEQGLGTCWIGWFKPKQVKKLLNIPAGVKLVSLITLGYPAEETGPEQKKRLSTEEICSFNRFSA